MHQWAKKIKHFIGGEPEKRAPQGIERRVHERFNIPIWSHITFKVGSQQETGYIRDISEGGVFVETQNVYKKDMEFEFQFYLPRFSKPIIGIARVMWIREEWGDPSEPPGMGFQFVHFQGESGKLLKDYIEGYLKRSRKKK